MTLILIVKGQWNLTYLHPRMISSTLGISPRDFAFDFSQKFSYQWRWSSYLYTTVLSLFYQMEDFVCIPNTLWHHYELGLFNICSASFLILRLECLKFFLMDAYPLASGYMWIYLSTTFFFSWILLLLIDRRKHFVVR